MHHADLSRNIPVAEEFNYRQTPGDLCLKYSEDAGKLSTPAILGTAVTVNVCLALFMTLTYTTSLTPSVIRNIACERCLADHISHGGIHTYCTCAWPKKLVFLAYLRRNHVGFLVLTRVKKQVKKEKRF